MAGTPWWSQEEDDRCGEQSDPQTWVSPSNGPPVQPKAADLQKTLQNSWKMIVVLSFRTLKWFISKSTLSGNTINMFPWNIKGDNKKLQHIFSDIILWDYTLKGNVHKCPLSAKYQKKSSFSKNLVNTHHLFITEISERYKNHSFYYQWIYYSIVGDEIKWEIEYKTVTECQNLQKLWASGEIWCCEHVFISVPSQNLKQSRRCQHSFGS